MIHIATLTAAPIMSIHKKPFQPSNAAKKTVYNAIINIHTVHVNAKKIRVFLSALSLTRFVSNAFTDITLILTLSKYSFNQPTPYNLSTCGCFLNFAYNYFTTNSANEQYP